MNFKKNTDYICIMLAIPLGLGLAYYHDTNKQKKENFPQFEQCLKSGGTIEKYVVSQFNYLNGEFGYVSDHNDCYGTDSKTIRKEFRKHFFQRHNNGWYEIYPKNHRKDAEFISSSTMDQQSSQASFDVEKIFKKYKKIHN